MKCNKKTSQARYELDVKINPDEVQMFHPVSIKRYFKPLLIRMIRPIAILLLNIKINHWTLHYGDKLAATMLVHLAKKEGSPNRIVFLLDPDHQEVLFEPMLSYCLNFLKQNMVIEQNVIIELRTSDEKQLEFCKKYDFEEIETMHLLGLKFD
ncbi:MAG: hypothetical protein KAS63_10350 [Candidatus Heimdallarchaeota archaeon]|nr:hypothetical protein [Candidatus Heimdallarchaeota archaeon]MCK4955754.1 hypothetical protein [Candidatus Heimdallarchaeota archaeon]